MSTKLHIVMHNVPYEFNEVMGVWSTESKAEQSRMAHVANDPTKNPDQRDVIEVELDKERYE